MAAVVAVGAGVDAGAYRQAAASLALAPAAVVGPSSCAASRCSPGRGPGDRADRQVLFEPGRRLFSTWRANRRHQAVVEVASVFLAAHPVGLGKRPDARWAAKNFAAHSAGQAAFAQKRHQGPPGSGGGHRIKPHWRPAPLQHALSLDDVIGGSGWQRRCVPLEPGALVSPGPEVGEPDGRRRLEAITAEIGPAGRPLWRRKATRFGLVKPTTQAQAVARGGQGAGGGGLQAQRCQGRPEGSANDGPADAPAPPIGGPHRSPVVNR